MPERSSVKRMLASKSVAEEQREESRMLDR